MSKRNNLTPTIWGPKTWFFLESAAIGYPENPSDDEKLAATNLLKSLEHLLPCHSCRIHYSEFLYNYVKEHTMDSIVENRTSFMQFIVDLHNNVLERTKKPTRTIEEVFMYYRDAYSNIPKIDKIEEFKNNEDMYSYDFLLYMIIGFMIGLIVYKSYLLSKNK